MPIRLKISLAEEQRSWLNSRREAGGFFSQSDVVRDLIRSEQGREKEALLKQFKQMEQEGSNNSEPPEVSVIVKKVKKARRPASQLWMK